MSTTRQAIRGEPNSIRGSDGVKIPLWALIIIVIAIPIFATMWFMYNNANGRMPHYDKHGSQSVQNKYEGRAQTGQNGENYNHYGFEELLRVDMSKEETRGGINTTNLALIIAGILSAIGILSHVYLQSRHIDTTQHRLTLDNDLKKTNIENETKKYKTDVKHGPLSKISEHVGKGITRVFEVGAESFFAKKTATDKKAITRPDKDTKAVQ